MVYTAFSDWVTAYKDTPPSPPGTSRLEKLPNELLGPVLEYVCATEERPSSCDKYVKNLDYPQFPLHRYKLRFCALTCRRLRDVALPLMYKEPMSCFSSSLPGVSRARLLRTLQEKPAYCDLVRHLSMSASLLPKFYSQIPELLSMCSRLASLEIPVHVFDVQLATRLSSEFSRLKSLRLLNHTGMTTTRLPGDPRTDDPNLDGLDSSVKLSISRLSFEEIDTTKLNLLQVLLPKCQSLQTLQFHECLIALEDLFYIPGNARITDLVIDDCYLLTSDPNSVFAWADFRQVETLITKHPALKSSLQLVRVHCSSVANSSPDPLRNDFVMNLPPTVRSFHWNRFELSQEIIPSLRKLATQVEYLSLQDGLTEMEVEEIVLGSWYEVTKSHVNLQRLQNTAEKQSRNSSGSEESEGEPRALANTVATLRLQQRFASLGLRKGVVTPRPTLKRLDLREMTVWPATLKNSLLLGPQSLPLEIIELQKMNYDGYADIEDLRQFLLKVGWKLVDGRENNQQRTWLERMA